MHAPVPRPDRAQTVVPAPGDGPGHWAGAPSAVLADGVYWLAYRLRRPVGDGRGYAVEIARSEDGVAFTPVATLAREAFGAASLERPALVAKPDGGWRLYVSCATEGSKHWWIAAVDADAPDRFRPSEAVTVLPGDAATAVKDPVVHVDEHGWEMFVCCHPLPDPAQADRMTSRRATSADGLTWELGPVVLAGRAGAWDQRGARITSVVPLRHGAGRVAYYDGRATALENWFERTGVAYANGDGAFHAAADRPDAQSAFGRHTLRYLSVVRLPDGGQRFYYEAARPDGAHDLVTELVEPVARRSTPSTR